MKCYTSGHHWHSLPDAGSIEAFNEGLGPRKGTQGQMAAHPTCLFRKAAGSFFWLQDLGYNACMKSFLRATNAAFAI